MGRGRAGVETDCFSAVTCSVGKVAALNEVVLMNKSAHDWPPSIAGSRKRNVARTERGRLTPVWLGWVWTLRVRDYWEGIERN